MVRNNCASKSSDALAFSSFEIFPFYIYGGVNELQPHTHPPPPPSPQQALRCSACIADINYALITARVYMTFPHFYRLAKSYGSPQIECCRSWNKIITALRRDRGQCVVIVLDPGWGGGAFWKVPIIKTVITLIKSIYSKRWRHII